MLRQTLVIAGTEFRLLLRNRAAAVLALLMPIVFGAFLAFKTPDLGAEDGRMLWTWIVTTQVAAMLGFTVYITTTITFAARREDRYLKRLRSGEVSDAQIIAGLAAPALMLATVQVVIILAMSAVGGLTAPAHYWPLALALLGGGLMCTAVGVLTSAWTRGAESAQITTAPFFFVLLMGTVLVMRAGEDATLIQRALPGGSVAELIRLAWQTEPAKSGSLSLALVLLAAWVVVPLVVASRTFRWSPRP